LILLYILYLKNTAHIRQRSKYIRAIGVKEQKLDDVSIQGEIINNCKLNMLRTSYLPHTDNDMQIS